MSNKDFSALMCTIITASAMIFMAYYFFGFLIILLS